MTAALLTDMHGERLTAAVLPTNDARTKAAMEMAKLAQAIHAFWFYDLRAKAADELATNAAIKQQATLVGHDNVKTTQRHHLRRGKIVTPTK